MQSRRQFITRAGAVVVGTSLFSTPSIAAPSDTSSVEVTDPVNVESFDGVQITGTLYEPTDVDGPQPVIVMTHGWSGKRSDLDGIAKRLAKNGYVAFAYNSRGNAPSGGATTVDGANEVKDTSEILTYLAGLDSVQTEEGEPENPRCGMYGASYGGGIQLQTAIEDDRLDAITPRIAWHSLPESLDTNEVLRYGWFNALYYSGLQNYTLDPVFRREGGITVQEKESTDEWRNFLVDSSPAGRLDEITTPTLLIHGWGDRLFPPNQALRNYREINEGDADVRLLMEERGHDFEGGNSTPTQVKYRLNSVFNFFAEHLRNDSDAPKVPTVSYYNDQSDTFRTYESLPDTTTELSLGESPAVEGGATELTYGDSVSFDFPITEASELAGAGDLSVEVTPTGDGQTHLFASVEVVDAEGNVTFLKDQITGTEVNAPGTIEFETVAAEYDFSPGETLRVRLALDDDYVTAATVPFGDGLFIDSDEDAGAVVHHSRGRNSTVTFTGTTKLSVKTEASDKGRGKEKAAAGRGR